MSVRIVSRPYSTGGNTNSAPADTPSPRPCRDPWNVLTIRQRTIAGFLAIARSATVSGWNSTGIPQLLSPPTFPNLPSDVTLTVPIVRFTRNGSRNRRFQCTALRTKKGNEAKNRIARGDGIFSAKSIVCSPGARALACAARISVWIASTVFSFPLRIM